MKKVIFLLIILVTIVSVILLSRQSGQDVKGVDTEKKISGIILPHHDFAREILTQSYEILDKNYDLVVIIGPNHFYPEIREVITSDSESGLNISDELVSKFIERVGGIEVNNEVVEGEHSIGLQKKYLEEYLPEAGVLPIVVPPNLDEEDIENLVNSLSGLPPNTLFMASVDFAHDMTYLEAIGNNKESIEAISSFDYSKINSYDDRHMDSQKSIVVLLKIMQKLDALDFRVLHDTHGALLVDDPTLQGTSYIVGIFR